MFLKFIYLFAYFGYFILLYGLLPVLFFTLSASVFGPLFNIIADESSPQRK